MKTNYEQYKEEIIEALLKAGGCEFVATHTNIITHNCNMVSMSDCEECDKRFREWLNAEYKEPIKLTQTEYHILKGLDGMFKWIARDSADYVLSVHADKPTKHSDCWGYRLGRSHGLAVFNHLFQFIKWEDDEPYLIDDLLNCEVIENG